MMIYLCTHRFTQPRFKVCKIIILWNYFEIPLMLIFLQPVMSNASNISPKHDLPSRVPQISAAALKFNRASFKIDEESFTGGIEDFEDFDSTEGYHSRHSSIDDVEEVEFIGNRKSPFSCLSFFSTKTV